MDERFIYAYDAEIERKMTENSIRSESYEKGKEESKLEIAKAMLQHNLSIDTIVKCTDLTEEVIKTIEI